MLVRPSAIALLALAVGCGPFVVFPGGGLEGNTASPPASWAFDEINTVQLDDQVQITAHRGSSAAAPENTMAAVKQAIRDGTEFPTRSHGLR